MPAVENVVMSPWVLGGSEVVTMGMLSFGPLNEDIHYMISSNSLLRLSLPAACFLGWLVPKGITKAKQIERDDASAEIHTTQAAHAV